MAGWTTVGVRCLRTCVRDREEGVMRQSLSACDDYICIMRMIPDTFVDNYVYMCIRGGVDR